MNKTFETLYSRDNLNNIREWTVEQQGNKYRVKSGIKDSDNQVVNAWTVVTDAKNSTDTTEQAQKECLALIKKKLKTGYSNSVDKVDTCLSYIEPILAKGYKDYTDSVVFSKKEWGMQCKFNGVCLIASKKGLYSRKGEKFLSLEHIEKALKPFFDKYPNSFLHGELFNDDYREKLNELIKLIRKTVNVTTEDLKESEKIVKFYVYDGCFPDVKLDESASYLKRKDFIDTNVIGKYDYCVEVKTTIPATKDELDKFFGERVDRGDEGVILRLMSMKYEHKRSKNLLKYKPLDSDEMTIVDIKSGSGNWSGKAKIITLKMKDGKVFDGVFKGTMLDAEVCLKEKNKWINQIVTIQFNGYTGLGCPQYAQFNYQNCLRVD